MHLPRTPRPPRHTLHVAAAAAALAALAGCSQTFPTQPLSSDDRQYEQSLQAVAGDGDAQVALGQLYFTHNEIDRAHAVLAPLVAAQPANAQALAWYGANNCKRAARRGPWLMGFDKLYLVRDCLGEIDRALALAPNDFTVQMVQMETGQQVDKFGSLKRAVATQRRVEQRLAADPKALPDDAQAQFFVTAARIERKQGNDAKAAALLERAAGQASAPATRQSIDAERQLLLASR